MVGHPTTYKTLETYCCIQQLNGFFCVVSLFEINMARSNCQMERIKKEQQELKNKDSFL